MEHTLLRTYKQATEHLPRAGDSVASAPETFPFSVSIHGKFGGLSFLILNLPSYVILVLQLIYFFTWDILSQFLVLVHKRTLSE